MEESGEEKRRFSGSAAYVFYVIAGSLYFLVKAVCYCFGFVYFCGVVLGLIASVLTVGAGIFAFKKRKKTSCRLAHWPAVVLPLLILPLTPAVMIYKLGEEMFHPEKMTVFFIFEFLAVAQVVLAVRVKEISNQEGGLS